MDSTDRSPHILQESEILIPEVSLGLVMPEVGLGLVMPKVGLGLVTPEVGFRLVIAEKRTEIGLAEVLDFEPMARILLPYPNYFARFLHHRPNFHSYKRMLCDHDCSNYLCVDNELTWRLMRLAIYYYPTYVAVVENCKQ